MNETLFNMCRYHYHYVSNILTSCCTFYTDIFNNLNKEPTLLDPSSLLGSCCSCKNCDMLICYKKLI